MLDAFFPFSYMSICFGFLIGIGITSVCFGFLSAGIMLIAVSIGIIRIMPLLHLCKRFVGGIFPDQLSKIEKNIGSSFKIKNPENIREGRHIYMWHPHGVFCLSQFFHIGTKYTNWPVRNIRGTAFSLLLWLPFMKEIYEELSRKEKEDMELYERELQEKKRVKLEEMDAAFDCRNYLLTVQGCPN